MAVGYHAFSSEKGDIIILILFVVPVVALAVRFIASIRNMSKREGEISRETGNLALLLPCYTEGADSLQGTTKSLASNARSFSDKLDTCLFIVCDGLVVGKGNSKSTSEIVQDILGTPLKESYGIAYKELTGGTNICDVFSGRFNDVPYIKITKYNSRGKRDSQVILYSFFRGSLDKALATELNDHLIYLNVIPNFQFLFGTDSDTFIDDEAVLKLMKAIHCEPKTVAVCGNVKISNAHRNFLTIAQVYEYYYSQYLPRAAESTFGKVICLPGCFCLMKLYDQIDGKKKMLILKDEIFLAYGTNPSPTLHSLCLMLGEDRFLTALIMKYLPDYKIFFVPKAECYTDVPETISVFLSQRRRWNNTTLHNIFGLVFMKTRFYVWCFFVYDFISLLLQPISVIALGNVILDSLGSQDLDIATGLAILLLPTLMIVTSILKKQTYVIPYIVPFFIATPFFFILTPIVCFWQMDDLSWGKTRKIAGTQMTDNVSIMRITRL